MVLGGHSTVDDFDAFDDFWALLALDAFIDFVASLLSGVLRLDSEVSTEAADAVGTCSETRAAPSRKSAMTADRRLTTIMMELAGCVVLVDVIRSDESQSEQANK